MSTKKIKSKPKKKAERYDGDKWHCPKCGRGYKYRLKDGCKDCKIQLIDIETPTQENVNFDQAPAVGPDGLPTSNWSPPAGSVPEDPIINVAQRSNLQNVQNTSKIKFDEVMFEFLDFIDEALDLFIDNDDIRMIIDEYRLERKEKVQISNFVYLLLKHFWPKTLKEICSGSGMGGEGILGLIFAGALVLIIIGKRIKLTVDLRREYKKIMKEEEDEKRNEGAPAIPASTKTPPQK